MNFQLVLIKPDGLEYVEAARESMEVLQECLIDLGHSARIGVNSIDREATPIIFCAQHLDRASIGALPANSIIFNLDQLVPGYPWFTEHYLQLLSNFRVWDFSARNVEYLHRSGTAPTAVHVPFGYSSCLARIAAAEVQDVDVLFFGVLNERRRRVLRELQERGAHVVALSNVWGAKRDAWIARAKLVLNIHQADGGIFEAVRVLFLLANGKAVISEAYPPDTVAEVLRGRLLAVPYQCLADECFRLLDSEDERKALQVMALQGCQKPEILARPAVERALRNVVLPATAVGLSICRNEADILESFVRHNLALLDALYLVDHCSSDGSREILRQLCEEDDCLRVIFHDDPEFDQASLTTAYAKRLARQYAGDWIFILDADEFISVDSPGALSRSLPVGSSLEPIALPWKTYIPLPTDDPSEANPAVRIKHRRCSEEAQSKTTPSSKVAFSAALAHNDWFRIDHGAHHIYTPSGPIPGTPIAGVFLAHFPVRSPAQLKNKILTSFWATVSSGPSQVEWAHMNRFARRFELAESLSTEEFFEIARTFPYGLGNELVLDPLRSAAPSRECRREPTFGDDNRQLVDVASRLFRKRARTLLSSGAIVVGRSRFGPMAYLSNDMVIGRSIALYGEWAAAEIHLLQQFLRPGDNVIDVGANIGTHAIPLAKAIGDGGVLFAFEPQPLVRQVLCTNVALNGLSNVRDFSSAVSDVSGQIHVNSRWALQRQNIGGLNLEAAGGDELIPMIRLDELNLPRIALMKMDVEGMEAKVIRGARGLIEKDRPVIFAECNLDTGARELFVQLFELKYRCWWHFSPYYNQQNFYRNEVNIFAGASHPEANIIALPENSRFQMNGLDPVLDIEDNWRLAVSRISNAKHGIRN